jgi:hypothetical protein
MKFFNSSKDDLFDAYKRVYLKEAVNPNPTLRSVQKKKPLAAAGAAPSKPAPAPFSGVSQQANRPQVTPGQPEEEENLNQEPDETAEDMVQDTSRFVNKLNQDGDIDFDELMQHTGEPGDISTYKDSDLPEWDYEDVEPLIQRSYDLKEPILLYGSAGIGKSTLIQNFGKDIAAPSMDRIFKNWDNTSYEEKEELMAHPEKYFVLVTILPNKYTPEDILGVPKAMNQKSWLVTDKFMWIEFLSRPNAAGILFLDELNTATARMLYSLYEVILDKAAAGTKFAPDVAVMAAGNLENELNPNLEPLPQPLVDRFTSGVLIADVDGWVKLAQKFKVDKRIISFVLSNPKDNFYAEPMAGGGGSPTPRSLMKFNSMFKHIYKDYSDKIKAGKPVKAPMLRQIGRAAAGKLGTKWARNFIDFLQYSREFNMVDLVNKATTLNKEKKAYLSALILYLYGRVEWACKQLSTHPTSLPLPPEVKEVMEGFMVISNNLDNNWNVNLWSALKKDMDPNLFKHVMTYTVQGDYDPATKQSMIAKMTKIGKILTGKEEPK